ncbi:ABC transporter permease [Rhizobium leguminosarum bv. viciae]|uniref:ABC transporter permease n=1 Tax=Rhizobium leguminosarum TaxID=384 RepID=UPI001441D339|nr:ABC transporter permease [Rhizobium leguminosarum]NKJ94729.1 ABC transporter permease [Rhizobium leguminosarum bv. viciae]NKK87457.1 ABC transporter permease [Rhizobium leguminosarum bv. viciae]
MTFVSQTTSWKRRVPLHGINVALVIFLVLYAAIAIIQPNYLEAGLFMNFLRRAAPLAILACGQLYVILTGGFDLSMGAIVTLVVLAASMLIGGDPDVTWAVIGGLYAMGAVIGLFNGMIVTFLKVPSIIATLGTSLLVTGAALAWSGGAPRGDLPDNFRDAGRLVLRDVPVFGTLPLAVIILIIVIALVWWSVHAAVYGKRLLALGDNPRAAQLAGVPVSAMRISAFVLSAIAAVTAGILVGGFSGVSVNAGKGLELQAIAACVIGGAQLLGGRGTVWGAVFGALSLFALFTLLNLLGLPQALRDSVQGIILIAAVGASVWRHRRSN